MKKNQLFPEGFGFALGKHPDFKLILSDSVDATILPEIQTSLIELIQGFALYSNSNVEVDGSYSDLTTDKPDPIYWGLELLKSTLISQDQLSELDDVRRNGKNKIESK